MPKPIKVELVAHKNEWEARAAAEGARILSALGQNGVAVHHIGSTSIPGIKAKPIIDMLPEVASLERLDDERANLENLGYGWWGENGIVNRRYCTLDDPATGERLVQLHCFQAGDHEIERHLAFRDYLRANPEKAREYDLEKERCRDLHPDDSHAYCDAKAAWIAALIPAAIAHHRSHAAPMNDEIELEKLLTEQNK